MKWVLAATPAPARLRAAPAREARQPAPEAAHEPPVHADDAREKTQARGDGAKLRQSKAARRRALLSTPRKPAPTPPAFVPLDPILGGVAVHAPAWQTIGSGLMGSEAWDQLAAKVRADLTLHERADFDAEAAGMDAATKNVLAVIHEQQKRRTREAAQTILLIVAVVGVVVLLVRWWHATREAAAPAPTTSAAPAPMVRPPYNPAIHGTLEQYRAVFVHLPAPLDAPPVATAQEPARVGLDPRRKPHPWEPSL